MQTHGYYLPPEHDLRRRVDCATNFPGLPIWEFQPEMLLAPQVTAGGGKEEEEEEEVVVVVEEVVVV